MPSSAWVLKVGRSLHILALEALVGEIDTFIVAFDNEDNDKEYLIDLFSIYLDLNIKFFQKKEFNFKLNERWFSPIDRSLRRELKASMGNNKFWFSTTDYLELINIRIICRCKGIR